MPENIYFQTRAPIKDSEVSVNPVVIHFWLFCLISPPALGEGLRRFLLKAGLAGGIRQISDLLFNKFRPNVYHSGYGSGSPWKALRK